jgi:hypothetical protein
MTCGDGRFRHAAGPYLLGALDSAERAEFDRHLVSCPHCRAEVDGLRPVVAALGAVSESDLTHSSPANPARSGTEGPGTAARGMPDQDAAAAQVPDTLLPGLLARAARIRRRRTALFGVLGGIAAAAVVALTVVLVTGTSGTPGTATAAADTHVMVMNPVHGGRVNATAMVADMPWGTEITLHCHYQSGAGSGGSGGASPSTGSYPSGSGGPVYSLRVVDSSGSVHDVGSWAVANGQDTVFTGGTSVPMHQIKQIDVMASDGSMVLTGAG